MRHKYKGRKLGTDWSHTKAMKRSLVQALFANDRIKTTEARAKEIRGDVDKIVTWAKKGDLHSRRLAIAALGNDSELVREIFEKVDQGMFEGRNGGYTRIMKLGPRKGDNAPMVIMELVTEPCVPKAERQAAAAKKAAPKKKADKADEPKGETVVEEIKESIEAAEENFAEEVQEAGAEQVAEEKSEAAKEAKEAEEVREEQMEAEAKEALEAEGKGPKTQEMPESVEKA